MDQVTGKRVEAFSSSGAYFPRRKWEKTAADRAHSGGRLRQPWGALEARVRGNRERRERGLNRHRRGVIRGKESDAIKRKSIGRGELITGVIWGRRLTSCMTWPDGWGRVVSEGEGKRKGRGARAPAGLLPRVRLGRGGPFPFFCLVSFSIFCFQKYK